MGSWLDTYVVDGSPSDWSERLARALDEPGDMWRNGDLADDGSSGEKMSGRQKKQAAAAQVLLRIQSALREFPALDSHPALGVLKHTSGALADATVGRRHALLTAAKGQLASPMSMRHMESITVAVVIYYALIDHGFAEADARKHTLAAMKVANRTGLKGAPVSASSLGDWITRCLSVDDAELHEHVQETLTEWRAMKGYPGPRDEFLDLLMKGAKEEARLDIR